MTLDVYPARFHFVSHGPLRFPPGKATNTIRGAFGTLLRRVAPDEDYQQIFEPKLEGGPSGLADVPRPFVIRAGALDGAQFAGGDSFHFDVHLFGKAQRWVPHFAAVFRELAREGLGAGRVSVTLSSVEPRPRAVVSLDADESAPSLVVVQFVTPTEIKSEGRIVGVPPFEILVARIRDRVSTLRELYGDGPLEIDFRGLAERARAVTIAKASIRHEATERTSTRTGQRHPLGGFVGEIEYTGDLREFMPYLRAAEWTGVGRHTVWGHGHVMLSGHE